MGKRNSEECRTRAAKAAKVDDEFAPLCQILNGEKDIPDHCHEMLLAAIPPAMKTVPDQRHAYENRMIDAIMNICKVREAKHNANVLTVQCELTSLDEKRQQASIALEEKKQNAHAKDEVKQEKGKIVTEIQMGLDAAKLAVDAKKHEERSVLDEKQVVIVQKTEYEDALQKVWEPLKNSTFEGSWKARNKAMKTIIEMIARAGAPLSLTSALALALKSKIDARSPFGKTVVEFGESISKDYVAKFASDIEAIEAQNAEIIANMEILTEKFKAEEGKLQAAQEASIAAQNEWCNEESAVVHAKHRLEELQAQTDVAASELANAEATLSKFLELESKIETLKGHRVRSLVNEDVPLVQEASPCADQSGDTIPPTGALDE